MIQVGTLLEVADAAQSAQDVRGWQARLGVLLGYTPSSSGSTTHRAAHDLSGEAKKQMEGVQREVSMLKKELLERFDRWHQAGTSGVTVVEQAPVDPADQLDDGEMFDKMEIDRVMSQDPDSVAFFQAHKKMAASHNLNKAATMRKQKLKRNI